MKKLLLYLFIFTSLNFSQSISKSLRSYLNNNFFDTTIIAVQIENLSKRETIFKKNEKLLLHPASNMKLLTSVAGLIFLGTEYKFSTSLFLDGIISNDTLYGNLIFLGGCDPNFTIKDFNPFLNEIKKNGIKYIYGDLIGDVSFKDDVYWGKGWMWDDDPSSTAPRLSALNLEGNCVSIKVIDSNYSITPQTEFVKVVHLKDYDNFIVDRNWIEHSNEIIIKGKAESASTTTINIINPEKYFLTVFREILDSNNIKLAGDIKISNLSSENSVEIFTLERGIGEVITYLNKHSDNLSAEMVLLALSEKYFGKPASFEKGIDVINWLIDSLNLNSYHYKIVDGSGVSHYNLISVELVISLLKFMYNQPEHIFTLFFNSLPVSGVDGTLKNRMKQEVTFSKVYAKTGTLSGVSCLSGYIKNKNDELIAFSIFIQNFAGSSKKARQIQDDICKIIYFHN